MAEYLELIFSKDCLPASPCPWVLAAFTGSSSFRRSLCPSTGTTHSQGDPFQAWGGLAFSSRAHQLCFFPLRLTATPSRPASLFMKLEGILVSSPVGSKSTARAPRKGQHEPSRCWASVNPAMRVKMSMVNLGTIPAWAAPLGADSSLEGG